MSDLAAIIIVIIIIARIAARVAARIAAVVVRCAAAYSVVAAAVVAIAAEYVRVAEQTEYQNNDNYNPYPFTDTTVIAAVVSSEKSHKITSLSIIVVYIMLREIKVLLYV